jgi:hypothetical protein
MDPIITVTTGCQQLVTTFSLRHLKNLSDEFGSTPMTTMLFLDKHILHQAERLVVKIVRHEVKIGMTNLDPSLSKRKSNAATLYQVFPYHLPAFPCVAKILPVQ